MSRKKKDIITVLLVVASILLSYIICICLGIYLVMDYTSRVPKLTPKQEVFEVAYQETYDPSDFVDVECAGEYRLNTFYLPERSTSEGYDVIPMGEEIDTVYMDMCGGKPGPYCVRIEGIGAEYGNSVEITLVVK